MNTNLPANKTCPKKQKTFSRNFILFSLLVAIITTQSSCVSIYQRRDAQSTKEKDIYPGASESLGAVFAAPIFAFYFGEPLFALASPLYLIDLPFSIALDTLLLPTDLIFGPGAIINKNKWTRSKQLPLRTCKQRPSHE